MEHTCNNQQKSLLYDIGKTEHANIWKTMFAIAGLMLMALIFVTDDLKRMDVVQNNEIKELQDKLALHQQEIGHKALDDKVERSIEDIHGLECSVFHKCTK